MDIQKQVSSKELVYAASVSQHTNGITDESEMMKKIMASNLISNIY